MRIRSAELGALRLDLPQRFFKSAESLLFLIDDSGGRTCDKRFVGQFSARLANLTLEPGDFLVKSCAFSRNIDFNFQHQTRVTDHLNRCAGIRERLHDIDVRKPGQSGEVGCIQSQRGLRALGHERDPRRGGQAHLAA